ncbi:MAG: YlmC/YmxH family sporulation protein [Clostridia bacterium]|nr:YlmC/YmxH family sporulation protein [Clostridia bacterium]
MILNTSCLRELDVINICTGQRLGWLCDFEIDGSCGKICAVFVSDTVFSFTGQKNAFRIPWEKIVCIGEDAILVDCGQDAGRCREEKCRTGKRGLFR